MAETKSSTTTPEELSLDLSKKRTEFSTQRTEWSMERTDMSYERTVLAHERTLMAWIRTATSMISFGFTIYKLLEESSRTNTPGQLLTPRLVGMTMIAFGMIGLLLAQVQHYNAIKRLKKEYPQAQRSVSSLMTVFILLFGIALFLGTWFRQ